MKNSHAYKLLMCSVTLVLVGCASTPKPPEALDPVKAQEAATQKLMEDLNAVLNDQTEKLKLVETLSDSIKEQAERLSAVEVKQPLDRRAQEKQDEAARDAEMQKNVQTTVSKVPAWFLGVESNTDFVYANATETSPDIQLSIDMAMLSGKRQLAQSLGEMVSSRMTDYAGQSTSNEDGAVSKEVERVTKSVVADVQVGGFQREKIEVIANGKNFRTYVRLSYATADLKRIMAKEIQKNEVLNNKVRRTKAFEELEKEIELAKEAKAKNKIRTDSE